MCVYTILTCLNKFKQVIYTKNKKTSFLSKMLPASRAIHNLLQLYAGQWLESKWIHAIFSKKQWGSPAWDVYVPGCMACPSCIFLISEHISEESFSKWMVAMFTFLCEFLKKSAMQKMIMTSHWWWPLSWRICSTVEFVINTRISSIIIRFHGHLGDCPAVPALPFHPHRM